jgi:Tol biopolymer transport system component
MRVWAWGAPLLALAAAGTGAWFYFGPRQAPLPRDLKGTLVYVSDRSGLDALYCRQLPDGSDRRLTYLSEPVREPALSPDGKQVAFTMSGRVGIVTIESGDVRFLTLGIDWKDAAPSWAPSRRRLVVAARKPGNSKADLHLLDFEAAEGVGRHPLTHTDGLDESAPSFSANGKSVAFIRTDNLFRIDLDGERTHRLTGGFRIVRAPRFLPSGRILYLWSQAKVFGIDVIDADGRNRETVSEGSAYYRSLSPSPDGRYFAATLAFDLGFRPADLLRLRATEAVRLLDARGRTVGELPHAWGQANHSPSWGG